MGEIKFGTRQLSNPTPSSRSKPIDIFCAVAGVIIAWTTTASFIPSEISNIIASILGLLIGIGQVLKPFWGVEGLPPQVQRDEVDEIETPKDK